MSPDWALAALVAVGHAATVVYLVNVIHAIGLTERTMGRVKAALLGTTLALTAVLAIELGGGGWATWTWPARAYMLVCLAVALLGLPVSTWLLRTRRVPDGVAGRADEVDLAGSLGSGELVGSGRHAWLLGVPGNESLRLRKREWDVTLPGLPDAWDGFSVVHLTDLHFALCFRRAFFERVAEEAAAWDADLVVFTGDLVDHDEALDWIVPVLSRLRGRLGTFAILGNHDSDHRPDRIRGRLEEAGFTDLDGRWTRLDLDGGTLAVGGTSYPWGPLLDLRAAGDADVRLLLSHSPDLFYRAAGAGIDLMLSGHNHGGQIRLPVVGPVFMPSRYSRRFDRGFFRSGRTLMHVSQGVAGKHPIRFGCVPEIGRLVLRARQDLPGSRSGRRHARTLEDRTPGVRR